MPKPFEIAIIGAGIAGVSLAIALHHRGINVTIYESAQRFGEIGAGIAFGPNAVQAMKICHEGVEAAFQRVRTRNIWPSKEKIWFDYVDAYGEGEPEVAFTVTNGMGQSGVHRAVFLEQLVKLLPEDIAQFRKRVVSIEEGDADKKVVIHFTDGTSAEADAVVGCDGIKSAVRRYVVGEDSPSAWPGYTYKYAYRALVPMNDAINAVGKEIAQNAYMHVSPLSSDTTDVN
jgi:salicylate hydroxylase